VQAIGALNTVLIRDGVTVGHNTDVTGFGQALREGLPGAGLEHVVLLGAGGAGAAVAHALAEQGAHRLDVVDPDLGRAQNLIASVRGANPGIRIVPVRPDDVAASVRAASGLINATPVGMAAHPGLPCPPDLLRESIWVADIVYRPLVTEFLRAARARGCRTMSGARMAVHQAADTFELITGLVADRPSMFGDFDELVAPEAGRPARPETRLHNSQTDERNS
jgi:shikimate dehydrogenase